MSVEAFGTGFEANFEQSFSLTAEYAYSKGGSHSTTTRSTSWEQGLDVIVPPHQIVPVPVTFIARQETADRDFTQVSTVYGLTKVNLTPLTPFKVRVGTSDLEQQIFTASEVGNDGEVKFSGTSFNNNIYRVCLTDGDNVRIELYDGTHSTGPPWLSRAVVNDNNYCPGETTVYGPGEDWRTLGSDENQFDVSSMRVIDLTQPYACIYYDKNFSETTHLKRCFNTDQNDPSFEGSTHNEYNNHVYSVEIPQEYVGKIEVILCKDPNYVGGCQTYGESTTDTGDLYGSRFSSIQISSLASEGVQDTFVLQDYLPNSQNRQFTLKGTYHRVGMMNGWFEKGVATRALYKDDDPTDDIDISCKCDQSGDASPDCAHENWCDEFPNAAGCGQVSVYSVFIKTRGEGNGTIRLNGQDLGNDFAISYTLDTIPALHKLEAVADDTSEFAGWETPTGTELEGKHTPLPGDTIYAVFDLQ